MFFYEGQSCPVCGKHFGEHDDIVACPQCGCPHHRDCWKQEGHCHFEADHGTENQWAQSTAKAAATQAQSSSIVRCPHCGGENPEFAEFCGHCGKDLDHNDWSSKADTSEAPHAQQYTPPTGNYAQRFQRPYQVPLQDPYAGIPRSEQIEGVTVDELAELIGPNSAYYLPRFLRMSRSGSKVSWNWAGFLLPHNWLLYRKNVLWGILSFLFWTALSVISQVAAVPFEEVLSMPTQEAMIQAMTTLMQNPSLRILAVIIFATLVLEIVLRVVVGLFGNYLYMRSILRKAKRLQQNPSLRFPRRFRDTGGVSFLLAFAPYVVTTFVMYLLILFAPI